MLYYLEQLLVDEDCPKQLFIKLIHTVAATKLYIDEIADLFAKYWTFFDSKYEFYPTEITEIYKYFKDYGQRNTVKKTLKELENSFNEILMSESYMEYV